MNANKWEQEMYEGNENPDFSTLPIAKTYQQVRAEAEKQEAAAQKCAELEVALKEADKFFAQLYFKSGDFRNWLTSIGL